MSDWRVLPESQSSPNDMKIESPMDDHIIRHLKPIDVQYYSRPLLKSSSVTICICGDDRSRDAWYDVEGRRATIDLRDVLQIVDDIDICRRILKHHA